MSSFTPGDSRSESAAAPRRHYATKPGSIRFRLGCLLLYGRRTPPESVVMLNGQVQVWNRGDRDAMFRIFDTIGDALGRDRA
jgi:hypothetical protein